MGVSPLQLVYLHTYWRYFVIKLHTWFCLSYFLKTNIKLYCIYQYFMSINRFFNTVSVSLYSRPITNETSHVTTHATHSDQWPTLARSTSLFLICCHKNINISHRLYSQGKHVWLLLSLWRHTSYCPQAWFAQLPAIVWKLEWETYYRLKNICIFELHFTYTTYMVNSCICLCNGYDPCFFMTRGRDRMVDGCYLWNQCLSVLTSWVRNPLRRGVLDATLCGKVCLWLVECRWFYPGTPVSSTNKTDRHDIIELLLKMTLNTITLFVTAFLLSLILQKILLHRKWPWNNTLYDSSWSVTNNIPVRFCCDCKGTTCRLTIKIDYIFPGAGLELAYTTDCANY